MPRPINRARVFTPWDLVDIAYFKLSLTVEFQASNRDIYRPQAIGATRTK
jgi:hypothetical protein